MEYKKKLNQIKALLSMDVKLEQMKLKDGVTTVEAEQFAPEFSIGIVTEDGIVPMPVGEYELENGQTLYVEQEGVITKIEEAEAEEVVVEAPAEVVEPEMSAPVEAPAPAAKRIVESVSKETFFEENEKLKAEIESLKAELAKVAKVEMAAQDEPAAEAISHNPEAGKVELFKYATNRRPSTKDTVYSKLFN
jgi:hypothetical protein